MGTNASPWRNRIPVTLDYPQVATVTLTILDLVCTDVLFFHCFLHHTWSPILFCFVGSVPVPECLLQHTGENTLDRLSVQKCHYYFIIFLWKAQFPFRIEHSVELKSLENLWHHKFWVFSYLSWLLIFQSLTVATIAFMESSICLIAVAKCDDSFIDEAT